MDGPSSQLDPYTPPNNHQISSYLINHGPTNQTLIGATSFGLARLFDNSSFECVQKTHSTTTTKISHSNLQR